MARQVQSLVKKGDYLLACELLQRTLGESWTEHVTNEFGQIAEPSALHKAIIGLDQRIVLTTNFDKLLETCWNSSVKEMTHYPVVLTSVDDSVFSLLKDHKNKYLVKIHGTVDRVSELVFSKSEYIRLAFGNALYTSFLEVLLLNYTFLFIGFSMSDPAICSLMETYALRYPKARPHYIFSPKGDSKEIIEINKRLRKLHVISYDKSHYHQKLPGLIDELKKSMLQKRRELLSNTLQH